MLVISNPDQLRVPLSFNIVNYPRINAGASGFTEGTISTVLHRLEIGQSLP